MIKLNPERERFLVPYACRDPEILKIEIWRTRTSLKQPGTHQKWAQFKFLKSPNSGILQQVSSNQLLQKA